MIKGNPEIVIMLNERLAEEHAAIVQYEIHERMAVNCGYTKLAEYIKKRKEDELEHAKELIDRILYLGGNPMFANIGQVTTTDNVVDQFEVDGNSELTAIAGYTEGINICIKNNDFGTRKLLEHILEEEESHLNDIEANMIQITQLGIENYLTTKVEG